jgi:hypothetical protein
MRVVPTFIPETGDTLSAAVLHRIVDEAIVQDIVLGAGGSTGIIVASAYTAVLPSLQLLSGGNPQYVANSAVSFHPASLSLGLGACNDMVVYWDKAGGAGTQTVLPGWPVYLSWNTQTWTLSTGLQEITAAGQHYIPRVGADLRMIDTAWALSGYNGIRPIGVNFINLKPVVNAGYGVVRTIGMCDAFVHYSLSSSFSPGDLYAFYYNKTDIGLSIPTSVPISWHGSRASGVTACQVPYGVIRQVYTTSGVTNIAPPMESTTYSLGPQPFYVARIWFWGSPCL